MKTLLRSQELSCPSCISKIEKALKGLDGVEDAKVHFSTGRIEVEHNPDRVNSEALVETVRKAGYESQVSPF
ncbi:MAG: heavy-metal-associated domain-containing protein [Anaerolineales bacterium]|jgi:copper chaperone